MNELYWLITLGKINTFLGSCLSVGIIVAVVSFIVFVESAYNSDKHIKSKKILKLDALVILILSCGYTLIPSKEDLYLIYGAGTIMDYCKDNSKVKEVPDKAIDALNRYIDSLVEDKKE